MSSLRHVVGTLVLMAAVALAASAAAQSLPRLPADITLPQTGDSPGKVTFSHATHISFQAKPDCTVCHPKLAPILRAQTGAKRPTITHEAMLKGQMCGACHGKTAHGFDDCTTCHK
jgi:c(7)-type cytochrome triheme protein